MASSTHNFKPNHGLGPTTPKSHLHILLHSLQAEHSQKSVFTILRIGSSKLKPILQNYPRLDFDNYTVMLGRKTRPVIGKLVTGGQGSGFKAGVVATSPRSPLDFIKIQSPRGIKNYGAGGVGLGIVAALEKSNENGTQIQATKALCNQNLIRSSPIPVNSAKKRGDSEEFERESLEDYTFVTCHGPNKKSHTRVYYNGYENSKGGLHQKSTKTHGNCLFDISPAPSSSAAAFPVGSDFLSSCHLCQKKLHGEDIYMYRGEKAFCSTECRYRQIVMDERKEKYCSSEASRSATAADISNSPYSSNGQQILTTGIFAI